MRRIGIVICCLGLALAGCKGEEKKAAVGAASGEVLPGSVSDAMLPLDTVKSQAPLAPKATVDGKAAEKPGSPAKRPAASAAADQPAAADAAAPAEPAAEAGGE